MGTHLARSILALALMCLPAAPAAAAQQAGQAGSSTPAAAGAPGAQSGAASGQAIATAGAANGVAPCSSCHGARGEGNPQAGFPRIAGQPAFYLARQLDAFANGARNNPVMTPIAKALSADQREAVARYYAGLADDAAGTKSAAAAKATGSARARALVTAGDEKRQVQACNNCHGPEGRGEPPTYPYLAGLSATYLTAALTEWKNGSRTSDPSGQMATIGKRLDDADIAALAQYFAALPVPAPVGTMSPPRVDTTTAAQGGGGGSVPVQGVGTEQGAPTTGGGQGPGGGGAASGSGPSGTPKGGGTSPAR